MATSFEVLFHCNMDGKKSLAITVCTIHETEKELEESEYHTGRGGGSEGGSSRPYLAWGGGRGGGSVGAWGISLTLGPLSFFVLPGPQARDGAFQDSPFSAA